MEKGEGKMKAKECVCIVCEAYVCDERVALVHSVGCPKGPGGDQDLYNLGYNDGFGQHDPRPSSGHPSYLLGRKHGSWERYVEDSEQADGCDMTDWSY
jgi:hypothetical protein